MRDSTNVIRDQLSDVFDLIEVRGLLTGGLSVRGDWRATFDLAHPLKMVAVVCGRLRATADGCAPIELGPGDVAILNHRTTMTIEGGPRLGPPAELDIAVAEQAFARGEIECGEADVILGGHVDVNPIGEALLAQALPPVSHVRASAEQAPNLHAILAKVIDEVRGNRVGSAFAVHQQGQLLLLEVLRAFIAQTDELPPGWLRLLSDERLRAAVAAMHDEPGKPWRLEELARISAMSRTSFAERFRSVAGVPPLTYLNTWRMQLARNALRDSEARVAPLAARLGYASESAFSNAFKRQVGMSPLRYRAAQAISV
ncbi:AraC family transcriptional regulator [Mycolicibacterium parafortuitum]|uniref:Putative AraC family transcriptional regulator [Kitasatospora setae KM-6054] n=1 Tax=Mycolicibacterium parafortuitum TaxID=39692 RepID=A0A375YFV1_MYCPF|nr:AraC family transcriptional regulator [Mycolicibacterium parafortuitum]ORB28886.1 AraC family transcriptional regulator [Mycolicibacterium parafortuitum]SRX79995.1 putative AraC family transcriptional regulator [Kitasatospora setae KM-6054] [Mycolicibacterium parafortuitum]